MSCLDAQAVLVLVMKKLIVMGDKVNLGFLVRLITNMNT